DEAGAGADLAVASVVVDGHRRRLDPFVQVHNPRLFRPQITAGRHRPRLGLRVAAVALLGPVEQSQLLEQEPDREEKEQEGPDEESWGGLTAGGTPAGVEVIMISRHGACLRKIIIIIRPWFSSSRLRSSRRLPHDPAGDGVSPGPGAGPDGLPVRPGR